MSRLDIFALDLSDPRVAADLDSLARGTAAMERDIAEGEAAARRFAADTAVLRAGLAAERAAPVVAVVVIVAMPESGVDDDDTAPALH